MGRASLIGIAACCLLGASMITWPLFGNPPYGFYAPMKWVVAFASGAGAWAAWGVSKALLPLSVLLVASGGVGLFGRMRREEWVPFNWASLVLLSIAAIICAVAALKTEPASRSGTR